MKDRQAGYEELSSLASRYPNDVQYTWHLLNFAFELGNKEDALKYEKQLRELEGPDGSLWRFAQARRLAIESRDVHDDSFVKATQLLSQLQGLRPTWIQVYMLGADIAQRKGDSRQAARDLTKAVELGARQPTIIQVLVSMLYQQGRMADAEQLLGRLGELGNTSGGTDLSGTVIELSLKDRDYERALRLAEDGVKARPDDATAYLWLGRAMLAANRPKDAEAAFKNAVRKGPQEVRSWLTLISFYSQLSEVDKARATVKRMEQFLKLSGAQQSIVWAQAHEIAGDIPGAAKNFLEAAEAASDDTSIQKRVAQFFETRDPAIAEKCLRRMLEVDPKDQNARYALALILAGMGEARWKDAWELVSTAPGSGAPTAADRRIQIRMLFRNGGKEQRTQARKLLEELAADPKQGTPDDLLTLAQLNEGEKNLPATKELLVRLASREKTDPASIARLVDFLLRNGELDDAETWLSRLESAAPDNFTVLQLRTQWLKLKNRGDEIVPLVDAFKQKQLTTLPSPNQRNGILQSSPRCMPRRATSRRPERPTASCTPQIRNTTWCWRIGCSARRKPAKPSSCSPRRRRRIRLRSLPFSSPG